MSCHDHLLIMIEIFYSFILCESCSSFCVKITHGVEYSCNHLNKVLFPSNSLVHSCTLNVVMSCHDHLLIMIEKFYSFILCESCSIQVIPWFPLTEFMHELSYAIMLSPTEAGPEAFKSSHVIRCLDISACPGSLSHEFVILNPWMPNPWVEYHKPMIVEYTPAISSHTPNCAH